MNTSTPVGRGEAVRSPRRRVTRILSYVVLALAVVGGLVIWWAAIRPLPKTTGTLRLSGLRGPVEVERDDYGIARIRAQSLEDLYLAQGFVTAQDRLWQLEMMRRVARGEISEIAGPGPFPLDLESRTLGLRLAAENAAARLPEDQKQMLEAYARGVNEFLRTHASRLPVEFRILRHSPRPWTVVDSLAIGLQMFRILTTTWRDEIMKAALLERAGPERVAEILPTRSDRDHPPGEELPGPQSLVPSPTAPIEGLPADLGLGTWDSGLEIAGSNNWVLSGAHTASGKPMLANDPHLEYSVPCTWYTVHLEAPGMHVAGVSLPGLPAVIIGHNERIAWGVTNLGADVQDLYLETFDPGNPQRYLVDGRWQEAQVRRESIAVRNQRDRQVAVTVTRHGPLVINEPGRRYALRWVALEAGGWGFPFAQIDRARNWEEFTAALRQYPGPAQNFVYADADGNIGYYGAGLLPIRPKGDGSLPLRGDSTANDWSGYIPFEQLPHVSNPPSGILATANGRVVPDGYPYPVATRWASPDRTERIYALLKGNRKFAPEDFRKFQVDVYAGHHHKIARALAEAVERTRSQEARLRRAAEILRVWDGQAKPDSPAASMAQFARQELLRYLLRPVLGDRMALYGWPMSNQFLEMVLRERPARWLPPGVSDYDRLLVRCLDAALDQLEREFGGDEPQKWRWGRVMQTTFVHALGGRIPGLKAFFNIGPFEQSGNGSTVKQTTHTLGPSMRFVVDFGNPDGATLTLSTGQSGQPLSPHYRDQFVKWISSGGVPLPFRNKVARPDRLTLRP